MKKIKPVFNSTYNRKAKMYSIRAVNKFGGILIHNCNSKEERDGCREKWKADLSKKFETIIPTIRKPTVRKPINNVDPVWYYYTEICEGEGLKYVIENFHAKMINNEGEQFFMMFKEGYVDELQVAKFYLMNKWEKEHLQIDDNYVEYWKSYRWKKGYYLVVLLPKLKFRDNQIGFYVRVVFGRELSYMEARRIWENIDSVGFEHFEIAFDDILDTNERESIALDRRVQRLHKERVRKLNKQLKQILEQEAVQLTNEGQEKADVMKIRVPKHYRIQRKVLSMNMQFGAPIDREIKREIKQREIQKMLGR